MQKNIHIQIDTTIDNTVECPKLIKRGDTLILTIKVYTNAVLASLTGQTIDLILKKADDTLIEKTITSVSGGVITATLDVQATNVAGIVYGEVQISDINGQTSTNNFTFVVDESLADDVIIASQHDIQVLNDLKEVIADAENTINVYEEHATGITDSITAVEALEDIKGYIDTNLPDLEANNASAVVNNNNLQNSIAQSQTSKSALDASVQEANEFVTTYPDASELIATVADHTTQLSDVANKRNILTYATLAQLNLDSSANIQAIIKAMPNGSIFIRSINESDMTTVLTQCPYGYGTIIIEKAGNARTCIKQISANNSSTATNVNAIYFCNYNSELDAISSWKQIATDDTIKNIDGRSDVATDANNCGIVGQKTANRGTNATLNTPYTAGLTSTQSAIIETYLSSSSYGVQIWYGSGGDEIFIRKYSSGTWGSWKKIADGTDTGWITLPLGTVTVSTRTPLYRKIGNRLSLAGNFLNVTADGATVGTLPSGYRPPASRVFVISLNGANVAKLLINTDGTIVLSSVSTTHSASLVYNLDNVSFLVD